jgi:hypothetical protein
VSSPKLQLTNGYDVDFDQLSRFVGAMEKDGRARIPIADLAGAMGIAERQAENVGSMARAFGLAEPITYRPSPLAKVILANDRFFDDLGTLWFLHYVIAASPRHTVWNRFVNEVVPENRCFTQDQFLMTFADLSVTHSSYSARAHVRKEVRVVLDAYTNRNLARIAYLQSDGMKWCLSYREPVPALVLAACVARFKNLHRNGHSAIVVGDLLTAPNSPGLVCQIPEDRLRASLEELKTEPGFSLESRADLDQVRLTDDTADYVWMERYYARR